MKTSIRLSLLPLLMLLAVATAAAKGPEISFASTTHEFGTIKSSGGTVTCEYRFTNTGDAPLIIVNVTNGGCGCTKPEYPKHPVQPGETGSVKITFNPSGRKGEFNRQVKVTTNAKPKTTRLKFSGAIVP